MDKKVEIQIKDCSDYFAYCLRQYVLLGFGLHL